METVTFYSYKGGVGRSLALTNIAHYLSSFGQKVFCLDLDLEAPGLHYKFASALGSSRVGQGVVEYLELAQSKGTGSLELGNFVMEIPLAVSGNAPINLMPAGKVPTGAYWRALASLNWQDLFYSETATGIPIFLELVEKIKQAYSPDYLLIDARTGITEVGGVATAVLPDQVVCLLANNSENLDGARTVLRSIQSAPRLAGRNAIKLTAVLTRIPTAMREELEQRLTDEIRVFLNEPASDLASTLNVPRVFVLHSEPELQVTESVRVGGNKGPSESLLLRDYLRLFTTLIPKEIIEPRLFPLITQAQSIAFDAPAEAQRTLEELATVYPHSDSFLALLKFYRLAKMNPAKLLETAQRYWDIAHERNYDLLWSILSGVDPSAGAKVYSDCSPEFMEDVWSKVGGADPVVGRRIAAVYEKASKDDRALGIYRRILDEKPTAEVFEAAIAIYRRTGRIGEGLLLADKNKDVLKRHSSFQVAWAQLAVAADDTQTLMSIASESAYDITLVRRGNMSVWASFMMAAGRAAEITGECDEQVVRLVQQPTPSEELAALGRIYVRIGQTARFEELVRMSAWSGETESEFLRSVTAGHGVPDALRSAYRYRREF